MKSKKLDNLTLQYQVIPLPSTYCCDQLDRPKWNAVERAGRGVTTTARGAGRSDGVSNNWHNRCFI